MTSQVDTIRLFDRAIVVRAAGDAVLKLDPRHLIRNPVIFTTEVIAVLVSVVGIHEVVAGRPAAFSLVIAVWLWITVLFATFAEAVAEGRGRVRADALRRARSDTMAKLVLDPRDRTIFKPTPAPELHKDDLVLVETGDIIPSDGEIIEGIASVNESAITGESAPVIREAGGDRSAVTGGTQVVSDFLVIRITAEPGSTFLDRMIALVEGAERRKTPNEIALDILLAGLTVIFVIAVATLPGFASYSKTHLSIAVLAALFVCLIPTTIGGLLSAIGIAGMDRLIRFNVVATSGRAVEAAGDVDALLLDKTGTITFGNRMASALYPVPGVDERVLAEAAAFASLGDETPEGRSIVTLVRDRYQIDLRLPATATLVPFSANTRVSGIESGGRSWRKGAVDSVLKLTASPPPAAFTEAVSRIARAGSTPLALAVDGKLLGAIELKDIVKPGIKERFADLRRMGIRTIMVTGDNRITAAAIAAEAGVDDMIAEATPQDKLGYIRKAQEEGRLVAMCGDGTNDAPALAQADVGVAMQTGTQAAREAGNMVDLDSDPTKLIEIVEIGKQLLITRGALTTFSIANDISKYFAILPAIFVATYPGLQALNIMGLTSPESAILAAVIFNALIIVVLVPLALRGVRFRAVGAAALLRRNLLIYGLGGIAAPFIGIKAIDMILTAFHIFT
ncbi:potassium-transporting ATPase subunit KdpB [Acidiphilium acidophilum]|uniref:Potassium-transporting ATPase ATP-binding subunit n=1 Tax=Acidiphilium acidophilum TaxID=76588 RepID=A0AAW9DLL0_ACIAO|nr:potassium-transporting ATPase subunit KdpB [Acidiphilium acidophilum]MDX5929890.1 potassium-transporting ATPase subunit KdpB [Acidiphilium acidophilum]GBR74972.1 potassium transporter ATPase B chain KdpB [Acidiphilium acidophilum DSM 700]